MIYFLFVIFIVIASILMIGIVLIQESKGGGLASNFSSRHPGRSQDNRLCRESHMGIGHRNGIVQHRMCLCSSCIYFRDKCHREGSHRDTEHQP